MKVFILITRYLVYNQKIKFKCSLSAANQLFFPLCDDGSMGKLPRLRLRLCQRVFRRAPRIFRVKVGGMRQTHMLKV